MIVYFDSEEDYWQGDAVLSAMAAGDTPRSARESRSTSNASLEWRSLAAPGATSRDVLERQLPELDSFAPDLVTLVCGANDVLLARQPDVFGYATHIDHMLWRLRGTSGLAVVTATCPELGSGRFGAEPVSSAPGTPESQWPRSAVRR